MKIKVKYPEFVVTDDYEGATVEKFGYVLHFDTDHAIVVGQDNKFKRLNITELTFVSEG